MTIRSSLHLCPGRSAKRAMRLRRPRGLGEAEDREKNLCDMENEHLLGPRNPNMVGILSSLNKGRDLKKVAECCSVKR